MIGPRTFLEYERYRHLKLATAMLLVALVVYVLDDPPGGRSGSSWTGYGLGTLSALIIAWLMWLGVRKRRYRAVGVPFDRWATVHVYVWTMLLMRLRLRKRSYRAIDTPLRGWTSAHVYLGTALLLLVPLHSAFEFGMNVHTLAYALMCAVIVTGILGVACYSVIPTWITRNRNNTTLAAMFERIAEIDADCQVAAAELPDVYAKAVTTSINETRIGGGLFAQLSGRDEACGTRRALASLHDSGRGLMSDAKSQELKLLELLARKDILVRQIRRDVRWKALLELWLIVHVPLAFATCAAVVAHVFVVFWYH